MFCNNDNEDVLSKQTDKRICQLLIRDIFVTRHWKNHDDWIKGYPASRISPSVQRKVWILCKPVILFCCTKETVVEGIIFRDVPLACLAGVQRERWLRRASVNQSTEQALYFCVFQAREGKHKTGVAGVRDRHDGKGVRKLLSRVSGAPRAPCAFHVLPENAKI